MADFCAQCAVTLNFPETDFPKREKAPPGYGYQEICEHCGFIFVDGDGNCLGNCFEGHNNTPKIDPTVAREEDDALALPTPAPTPRKL